MPTYHVEWEIEVEADSHAEAARKALEIQRDADSFADYFTVREVVGPSHAIDLGFGDGDDGEDDYPRPMGVR